MTFRASSGGWGRSPGRMGSSGRVAVTDAQIAAIFAATPGAKVWYDPSDTTTLFQDATGLIPVTSPGQEIGRITDKSGAGNFATQAVLTSLPLWQTQYASFDGVNDSWQTTSIDFTGTDKVTVIVGIRKESDATVGTVINLNANTTVPGTFRLSIPSNAGSPNGVWVANGSAAAAATAPLTTAPVTAVISAGADVAAPLTWVRVNGVQVQSTASLGAGNFSNGPLYVGQLTGLSAAFNGRIYGLMIFGRLMNPTELSLCERYMAQKTGITF